MLAGDASNRSYDRLTQAGERRVLMVAPPEKGEDIRPFRQITGLLRGYGLSAPQIFADDAGMGLMLIEDLGDDLFARLASDKAVERQMYDAAVDVLAALTRHEVPVDVPPYDIPTYQREARLVIDWYIPAVTGEDVDADATAEFLDLIAKACAKAAQSTLVLRDYHAENLLWLPDRVGNARVGLLDYQDALIGDPAYDLVSLLEDARRDVPIDLQQAEKKAFIDKIGVGKARFDETYSALGAQRNLKIVGIFARLAMRDEKLHYPDLIPRVWQHLQRDLQHPALSPLADWVTRHVPPPTAKRLALVKERANAG